MPTYKLTYFNARAMGEHIRLIFVVSGVPYEELTIPLAEWADYKGKIKYGHLPTLEIDGKFLSQSFAIGRYLGTKYKLVADDAFLAARCDEVADHLLDLRKHFIPYFFESDPEKKEELKQALLDVHFPRAYPILEELVSETPGKFMAGNRVTWQDLFVANWLDIWGEVILSPGYLEDFPALKTLKEAVFSIPAVKIYVKKRPQYIL